MLAQSFKPAAELGITEPQRDALCKTLVLLETGKLRHATKYVSRPSGAREFSGLFNMKRWGLQSTDCGTVCCIGGTAELIGGVNFYDMRHSNSALYRLFYPNCSVLMFAITPAQAATALRSYLTTGDAKWHEAVADQRKQERV